MEVGHFFGGTSGSLTDDNGLHRLGSARCYTTDVAPTIMIDSHVLITSGSPSKLSDHDNAGGAGEGDLDNAASGSAAGFEDDVGHGRCWIDTDGLDELTNDECTGFGAATQVSPTHGTPLTACCIAADTGTCDEDDNKMYIYLGVAGDAGSAPQGLDAGWQEATAALIRADNPHLGPNILSNGDFEWNATSAGGNCDTGDVVPSEWAESGAATFEYNLTQDTEGSGCELQVTADDGADGLNQILSALQASSVYRVTARVKEDDASDVCTMATTGASSDLSAVSSATAYHTITGTFTTAAALDIVTLTLINTLTGDICDWDHISVRRETRSEIVESGIVAVYDTYITAGSGASLEEEATGFADVPELSIDFTPPTPGWIMQIGATISVGCTDDCNLDADEGFTCRLEKNGNAIAGTLILEIGDSDAELSDVSFSVTMNTIEIDPIPGIGIQYTVACREEGENDLVYNLRVDGADDSESNLWMMAFPPH